VKSAGSGVSSRSHKVGVAVGVGVGVGVGVAVGVFVGVRLAVGLAVLVGTGKKVGVSLARSAAPRSPWHAFIPRQAMKNKLNKTAFLRFIFNEIVAHARTPKLIALHFTFSS
jgi:hypothetical protein